MYLFNNVLFVFRGLNKRMFRGKVVSLLNVFDFNIGYKIFFLMIVFIRSRLVMLF